MLLQDIRQQIDNIDKALDWLRANVPDQYEQRFLQLVRQRGKLRRLAAAEEENPGIAAYGESQKGKSYITSNLLQRNGEPFKVKANGREYDFIERINPPTINTEATGVVTRFSAFRRHPERYKADYPVYIKLLSPAELAAVLCDGYFNDVHNYQTLEKEQLEELGRQLQREYAPRQEVQDVLIEDDVLELQAYLQRHVGAKSKVLWNSDYFMQVALVVRKVPVQEWNRLFAPLWHNEQALCALFDRLLACLARLDYRNEAYLPIEAVLNNDNTIMGVECLKGLVQTPVMGSAVTDVYYQARGGEWTCARAVSKAELSAVCKETLFKVEEEYLTTTSEYCMDMVAPEVRGKLTQSAIVKDILRNNDLVDFPGARPRLSIQAADIPGEIDNIVKRGKVAFLFNKYSEAYIVNILIYCHDYMNNAVTQMWITLDEWIKEYVGATPEKRAENIARLQVSPFFVVATKFNTDMARMTNDALNDKAMLRKRWDDRFMKILYSECFQAKPDMWFHNWEAPGATFKNTYLLRDYKYSSETGNGNHLYSGFTDTNKSELRCLLKEHIVQDEGRDIDFYSLLRQSFVENENVRKFFADPAKSWDVAATINNDGSLYLVEQLSIVARRMGEGRVALFTEKLNEVKRAVRGALQEFYHDSDAEKRFEENLRKANRVARELDFTCNDDNYYFGHLIQALQITEKEVYREVHRIISSGELTQEVHDYHNYEIIERTCGPRLAACATDDERWQLLMQVYGFIDKAEAQEYLARRGVDSKKLFAPVRQRKINSVFIAEAVFRIWQSHLASPGIVGELAGEGSFDSLVMTSLLDNIILTARELQLAERLEQLIAGYVNVVNLSTVNVSFIADIMASEINNFVNDLGYHFLPEEKRQDLKELAGKRSLPLYNYIEKPRKATYDEKELTALFRSLNESPQAITPAVEQGYYQWKEYMTISFIACDEVGGYDREANDRLRVILDGLQ